MHNDATFLQFQSYFFPKLEKVYTYWRRLFNSELKLIEVKNELNIESGGLALHHQDSNRRLADITVTSQTYQTQLLAINYIISYYNHFSIHAPSHDQEYYVGKFTLFFLCIILIV